jgi:hypothetical protein
LEIRRSVCDPPHLRLRLPGGGKRGAGAGAIVHILPWRYRTRAGWRRAADSLQGTWVTSSVAICDDSLPPVRNPMLMEFSNPVCVLPHRPWRERVPECVFLGK